MNSDGPPHKQSLAAAIATILMLAGCGTASVDMDENARVLGLENGVRVDANFFGLTGSGRSASISVTYEIENQRAASIAFAEVVPIASLDSETGTFTVIVGSEVPGQQMLPRLMEIKPGERLSFSTAARLVVPTPEHEVRRMRPRDINLKVVYLENVEPFRELVGIPEVAVRDPNRADELFLPWVEGTRSVTTNAVPLQSRGMDARIPDPSAVRP
jgi:hypothetical protein